MDIVCWRGAIDGNSWDVIEWWKRVIDGLGQRI
jgi:hypothetical protein